MLENFKTDIIYYDTASDFELEFNLCGCCRMRLFNEKCSDKKSLLLSLSRAVSRSRVIIVTAPLFSDFDIFKTIATAIDKDTEIVDNSQYNIASNTEITVINGSLPLVTEDGIFGGCIIESGPQSLILLTDNAAVRKAIMKTLIHPYIKEIASGKDVAISNTEIITEPDLPESDNTDTEKTIVDASDDTLITNEEIDTDDSNDTEIDDSEETNPLYTNIDTDNEVPEDNNYYDDTSYYVEPVEEKSSPFNIWMLIISIILLVGLAVLCFCIFYVPTKAGVSPSAYLKDVLNTMFK
jgi:hypothetical protein